MAITAITSVQEFDEKVLGAKGLAIVDFWAVGANLAPLCVQRLKT